MRIGEAVALERRDVNLVSGVITVREAKFGRFALVPLHRTATEALCTYAKRRDTLCDIRKSAAFFVSSASTPLRTDGGTERIQRDHHENRHPDQPEGRGSTTSAQLRRKGVDPSGTAQVLTSTR